MCAITWCPLLHAELCSAVFDTSHDSLLHSTLLHLSLCDCPSLCIARLFAPHSALGDTYILYPNILSDIYQQSMTLTRDSTFFETSGSKFQYFITTHPNTSSWHFGDSSTYSDSYYADLHAPSFNHDTTYLGYL